LLPWTPKNRTMALIGGEIWKMSAKACGRVSPGEIKRSGRDT
jgi:hypothetical protein